MEELNPHIRELLKRDPEVARAVNEVDRDLIRAALERSPMERVRAATSHLKALRRFKRASPRRS